MAYQIQLDYSVANIVRFDSQGGAQVTDNIREFIFILSVLDTFKRDSKCTSTN